MNNKESQSNDKQLENDTAKEERNDNGVQNTEETLSEEIGSDKNEHDVTSETEINQTAVETNNAAIVPVPVKKSSIGWIIATGILAVALVVVLIKPPFGGGGTEAVATVNGSSITKNEVYDTMIDAYGAPTVDFLILQKMIEQEAEAQSIKITDKDRNDELESFKLQFPSDEEFQAYLDKEGTTVDKLREEMHLNTLVRIMLGSKTDVTDEEIKTVFDQNIVTMQKQPEKVRASHILVKTKEEADAILAELKAGADFAELAKSKSTDGSAAKGGDLGFFPKGKMVAPFEEAVFALEVNAISDAVKSEFGYHIIKKTDYKAAYTPTLEEKKDSIRVMLTGQEAIQLSGPWIEELKAKAKITNTLVKDEPTTEEAPAPASE